MSKKYEIYQDNFIRKSNKIDWEESAKNHISIYYKSLSSNKLYCISLLKNDNKKVYVNCQGKTFHISKQSILKGYIYSVIENETINHKKSLNTTNENNYYVYCHINKINHKMYIGITSQNPFDRWGGNGKKYQEQILGRAIRKYGWDNFEHIVLMSNLSKDVAELVEIELIKKYNTTNPNCGYNKSTGGQAHKKLTDIEKDNLRKKYKGRKLTPEWNLKIRQSQTGLKRNEETKNRISNAVSIPVICLNNRKIYKSLTEASKLTSTSLGHISQCCNKKRKCAGRDEHNYSLFWMFYSEYIEKGYDKKSDKEILSILASLNIANGKHIPVKNKLTQKIYKSVPLASKDTGIGMDKIRGDLLFNCLEWEYVTNGGAIYG